MRAQRIIQRLTFAHKHLFAWEKRPCAECGKLTHWVNLAFECRLCRGWCTRRNEIAYERALGCGSSDD